MAKEERITRTLKGRALHCPGASQTRSLAQNDRSDPQCPGRRMVAVPQQSALPDDSPKTASIPVPKVSLASNFLPKVLVFWLSPLQLGRVAPSGKEEGKRGFKVDGWGESWTKNNKFNCNPGLHFHKLGFSLT